MMSIYTETRQGKIERQGIQQDNWNDLQNDRMKRLRNRIKRN